MEIILTTTLPRPAPVLDDEAGVHLANSSLEQEDLAPLLLQAVTRSPWLPFAFTDDETTGAGLANFARDQEDLAPLLLQAAQSIPWTPFVFTDEDPLVHLVVTFGLDQEDPLFLLQAVQRIPWTPTAFTDDETTGAGLANSDLEQEEPWVARTTAIPWTPFAFTDDEITGAGLGYFGLEQEEPWLAQTTAIPWLPLVFRDDETEAWPAARAAYFTVTHQAAGVLYTYQFALNNLQAATDPTGSNDVSQGYAPGSLWINKVGATVWICTSGTVGAANWVQV